jgi:hypothetical protein
VRYEHRLLAASTLLTAALAAPAARAQTSRTNATSTRPPATSTTTTTGHTSTGHATPAATTGRTNAATLATGHGAAGHTASAHPASTHGAPSSLRGTAATPPGSAARAAPGGRHPALYHGTFQTTSSTTVQITAPLAQTETRSTRETVLVNPGTDADLVFDVRSDNGDRCVLNANRNADGSITFLPGQQCQVTDNVRGVTLQVSLADGTGSVRGDALNLRIHWNVSGAAFFMRIVGTGTQTSSGRRMTAASAANHAI